MSGSERMVIVDTGHVRGLLASHHWSRVAPSTGTLTQHLVGRCATSWVMLLADDCHLEMGGSNFRSALLVLVFLLLCAVSGCPLCWSKTSVQGAADGGGTNGVGTFWVKGHNGTERDMLLKGPQTLTS